MGSPSTYACNFDSYIAQIKCTDEEHLFCSRGNALPVPGGIFLAKHHVLQHLVDIQVCTDVIVIVWRKENFVLF